MIAVCTKCGGLFETTTEDAYSPNRMCSDCHRQRENDDWSKMENAGRTIMQCATGNDAPLSAFTVCNVITSLRNRVQDLEAQLAAKDRYIAALDDALHQESAA